MKTAAHQQRQRDPSSDQPPRLERKKRRRSFLNRFGPKLVLLPTVAASVLFVYVFIGYTAIVSFSRWQGYEQDLGTTDPWYKTYAAMLGEERFQASLRNMIVFTVLFLAVAVIGGLILALAVREVGVGSTFFRNLFLFPYALSFIVTGVVWRWLFNPESGVNALIDLLGINRALSAIGVDELKPGWLTDPTVVGAVNDVLIDRFEWASFIQIDLGLPMALIPVVIAASWQYVGFSMAFFLAALGNVPEEVREAARVDGASWWQTQRMIVLPLIRPAVFGVVIVLMFSSLRIFDLIVAMSGSGPAFGTDVPALYVYDQMFRALAYNKAAAAAVVMLVIVAVVAIPYLWRSLHKKEVTN